jgi:hypothetical protein
MLGDPVGMRWLGDLIERMGRDGNVSAVVNVAKGDGTHTHVRRHQKIVQRNGETTVTTEVSVDDDKEPDDGGQA